MLYKYKTLILYRHIQGDVEQHLFRKKLIIEILYSITQLNHLQMAKLDLSKYGITGTTEIIHNPSYEQLFAEETKPELQGFEKGQDTELSAVNVMTGIYTGRSPKDKFLVKDATSENTVWWTSEEYKNDNKPVTEGTWKVLKDLAAKELSNKKLFVVDGYCGANAATCLKVRFIMEVAWQVTNKRYRYFRVFIYLCFSSFCSTVCKKDKTNSCVFDWSYDYKYYFIFRRVCNYTYTR